MCNLHEAVQGRQVVEVDVKGCKVNAIIVANVHDIPIFSPIDEFTCSTPGVLADYPDPRKLPFKNGAWGRKEIK